MQARILLVDDSPTLRNIVKIYLMGLGLEFIEADGATTALQLLRNTEVDLIITDISMPGMDGLTFVRTLRSDENARLRSVPVLVLTRDQSDETRKQGLDAGANAFVTKPVSSSNLQAEVARCLGGDASKGSPPA